MSADTTVYDYLFKKVADPRVYDWPLMSDPVGIFIIIAIYLICIKIILPSYMLHRQPYKLKGPIVAYNILQIIACSMIVYGSVTSGWTTYTLGCQPVDYSEDKMAIRMASCMWWILVVKIIDLFETPMYILRKKYSQVSTLHVYHHASTVVIAWIIAKYFGGGMGSFALTLNNCVHVLMYTYYLLSSLGPGVQKKLEIVKSKLTMIQITHMIIIQIHAAQSLWPSCPVSSALGLILIFDLSINLAFFANFYRNSYIMKKTK